MERAELGGDGLKAVSHIASLGKMLLNFPSEIMPVGGLLCTVLVAVVYLSRPASRNRWTGRPLRILKVIFSARYVFHRSHMLDVLYFIFNAKIFGLIFGAFILSRMYVTIGTYTALATVLAVPAPTALPAWAMLSIATAVLYLAYEFGYWVDHYLSHYVPFLWEFHKVHHQAEVLSPLTSWRVHPVDTLVFANCLAITVGVADGVLHFAFGQSIAKTSLFDYSAVLVILAFVLGQLQHSQIWIPFTGIWGKLLISPAHHQIHHSTNPAHFNKNLGSYLAIFDYLFGTLCVPSKEREKLIFGVDPVPDEPHSLVEGLITPFERAYAGLRQRFGFGDFSGNANSPALTGAADVSGAV